MYQLYKSATEKTDTQEQNSITYQTTTDPWDVLRQWIPNLHRSNK